MRHILLFLVLTIFACGQLATNETNEWTADFEFETTDKETNKIGLFVTIRYRIESSLEERLSRKYHQNYRDNLLLPTISSISKKVMKDYSAGEIYNYKRDEVKQRLQQQTKTTFAQGNIELTDFLIRSVKLPDAVMQRFQKEHIERFQNAMNKCSKETKGAVTEIDRDGEYFTYEYKIEGKKYSGYIRMKEVGEKLMVGDSFTLEYACDDPIFHRVKK